MKNAKCKECVHKIKSSFGFKCEKNLRHFIHNNVYSGCEAFERKNEENLIYSYMLLAGAGAIVAGSVFCLVKHRDEISLWLSLVVL